jgi:hypothetical protein
MDIQIQDNYKELKFKEFYFESDLTKFVNIDKITEIVSILHPSNSTYVLFYREPIKTN